MSKARVTRSGCLWPDETFGPWYVESAWVLDHESAHLRCVGIEVRSCPRERHQDERVEPNDDQHVNWALQDRPPFGGFPSEEPAPSLTATVVRSIPVGELLDRHRRPLLDSAKSRAEAWAARFGDAEIREWAAKLSSSGRRPRYDRTHFEKVAKVYTGAIARGDRRPTQAVARAFTVSPSAAAKWVARARALRLLPATTKGVARGEERIRGNTATTSATTTEKTP